MPIKLQQKEKCGQEGERPSNNVHSGKKIQIIIRLMIIIIMIMCILKKLFLIEISKKYELSEYNNKKKFKSSFIIYHEYKI